MIKIIGLRGWVVPTTFIMGASVALGLWLPSPPSPEKLQPCTDEFFVWDQPLYGEAKCKHPDHEMTVSTASGDTHVICRCRKRSTCGKFTNTEESP